MLEHGWAHCLKDNQNGQPFDVIAAKEMELLMYLTARTAKAGSFRLSRIEENQHNAMSLWSSTGKPSVTLFAIRMQGMVILAPYRMLAIMMESGTKQATRIELMRCGRLFERWIEHLNRLDRKVTGCR